MSDTPTLFDESSDNSEPLHITINMKRLRMRDIDKLNKAQKSGQSDFEVMVPVFARVCNLTEEEVWDWDVETIQKVQVYIQEAMSNGIVKKTNNEA